MKQSHLTYRLPNDVEALAIAAKGGRVAQHPCNARVHILHHVQRIALQGCRPYARGFGSRNSDIGKHAAAQAATRQQQLQLACGKFR